MPANGIIHAAIRLNCLFIIGLMSIGKFIWHLPGWHIFSIGALGNPATDWEGYMADLNGWGTARMMVDIYGSDARAIARRRSEEALERDDMLSFERWNYLASVIGRLTSKVETKPIFAVLPLS